MRAGAISVVFAALLVLLASQTAAARNSCPALDPSSHIIAAGDILGISAGEGCMWPQIVPAYGKIVMPLVGEMQVLGQTQNQLAQLIRGRLSKYIPNPLVRLFFGDGSGERYYLDGEVNHPGPYCLETSTTVFEALDIAGGFRKRANLNKIRILRGSQVLRFNYKQFRKGKHPEQNILIEKGDHNYCSLAKPLY